MPATDMLRTTLCMTLHELGEMAREALVGLVVEFLGMIGNLDIAAIEELFRGLGDLAIAYIRGQ